LYGISLVAKMKALHVGQQEGSRTGDGSRKRTQKLHIALGDSDIGDVFDVEIRTDPKYGTPVYVLHGGQSRCPYEEGTLPREHMRAQIGSAQTTFLPPNAVSRIPLLLNNLSPTKEYWMYSLALLPSTNPDGLHVTVGGVPLLSNLVAWDVPGDTLKRVTLEISRAPNSRYAYKDIMIAVVPSGALGQNAVAQTHRRMALSRVLRKLVAHLSLVLWHFDFFS
jgi:hypothetical protein